MQAWRTDFGSDPTQPDNAFDLNADQITTITYLRRKGEIVSAEVELSSGRIVNYLVPTTARQLYEFMRHK